MKTKLLIAAILLAMSGASIAKTITLHCNYPVFSSEKGLDKDDFELTFIVDETEKVAYMVGNNGSEEVHRVDAVDGWSFIEVTTGGNVMSTAVTSKLKSVHSRNTNMFGELVATQYYGTCKLK